MEACHRVWVCGFREVCCASQLSKFAQQGTHVNAGQIHKQTHTHTHTLTHTDKHTSQKHAPKQTHTKSHKQTHLNTVHTQKSWEVNINELLKANSKQSSTPLRSRLLNHANIDYSNTFTESAQLVISSEADLGWHRHLESSHSEREGGGGRQKTRNKIMQQTSNTAPAI